MPCARAQGSPVRPSDGRGGGVRALGPARKRQRRHQRRRTAPGRADGLNPAGAMLGARPGKPDWRMAQRSVSPGRHDPKTGHAGQATSGNCPGTVPAQGRHGRRSEWVTGRPAASGRAPKGEPAAGLPLSGRKQAVAVCRAAFRLTSGVSAIVSNIFIIQCHGLLLLDGFGANAIPNANQSKGNIVRSMSTPSTDGTWGDAYLSDCPSKRWWL